MSRYNITASDGKNYSYGYDRPLGEYFLQSDDEELVGNLSNKQGTAGNVLAVAKSLGLVLPVEHVTSLASDLPF